MSRLSEDALRRGLEAANLRIASLERQLADTKRVVLVKPETRAEIEVEAEKITDFTFGKKKGKKFEKE